MRKYAMVIVAALLLFSVAACDKINVPGNIAGRVLDGNGTAMGFVTVQLTDVTSGKVLYQETSDDRGNYFFQKIDPGDYRMLTLWGGRDEVPNDAKDINLFPGKTLNIDVVISTEKKN